MLAPQHQWCPRCDRYVETEQKHTKVGRRGKLVKIIITCRKCQITLSSKTTSAAVVEEMQAEVATTDVEDEKKPADQ
ncbi:hypothetical protein IH992_20710 [Candidatus Poribacteria bacterium]|nr:hypothetical protein [Candidatus Poribacteria bacterium]